MLCQYCSAIFRAASTALAPSLAKKTRLGPALLQNLFGPGQTLVQGVAERLLGIMGLLFLGQGPRGLAQVNFALHDAIRRLLAAVMAAIDQAAPVHQFALARRDGQKTERRIGLPIFQKRREVIGNVAGREHAGGGMPVPGIHQGLGRGLQAGRQFRRRGGAPARPADMEDH